ncbi:hypothetical protein ACEQ8H_002411 [Pleosporales sp. CAS-2024a]
MFFLNTLSTRSLLLKIELDSQLATTRNGILKLGEKCNTTNEQEIYLMKMSMRVNEVVGSAVRGHYDSPFFRHISIEKPVGSAENVCRLRAAIQHLNIAFAQGMRSKAHKYTFEASEGEKADHDQHPYDRTDADTSKKVQATKATKFSRQGAVKWAQQILERSRGNELPGTFQPELRCSLYLANGNGQR